MFGDHRICRGGGGGGGGGGVVVVGGLGWVGRVCGGGFRVFKLRCFGPLYSLNVGQHCLYLCPKGRTIPNSCHELTSLSKIVVFSTNERTTKTNTLAFWISVARTCTPEVQETQIRPCLLLSTIYKGLMSSVWQLICNNSGINV
jgi:hypothetical protein